MGRISDALARAQGRSRPTAAEESPLPWTFDMPLDAGRPDQSDDRETFLPERSAVPARLPPHSTTPAAQPGPSGSKLSANAARHDVSRKAVAPEMASRLVTSPELPTQVKEQYRRLAATLHQAQREHGVRVLMVASSLPNEGKTLVAANLALTLSRSFGRRVLMIDADLRKPSLHALFGVPDDQPGLADGLSARSTDLVESVTISTKLSLVAAGRRHGDSMSIVTGGIIQRVIQEGAASFDWVILDTPPIGLLADAHVLAAAVDRVLFVIDAGRTPYDVIQRSVDVIGKERVIGTVLNRAAHSQVSPSGYRYESYYESDAPTEES